jgi:hypothetical protein
MGKFELGAQMGKSQAYRARIEKRDYPRVPTSIPATISIFADHTTNDCLVTDLSASGAGIEYHHPSPPAERICRLEISWFGGFDGITTRDGGTCFGVRFLFGEAERLDLLGKLTKFVEIGLSPGTDDDVVETIRPRLLFKTASGQRHLCEVVNISLRGVFIRADVRPPLGELVKIGSMYGRVDSHHGEGLGIVFVSLPLASERPPMAL